MTRVMSASSTSGRAASWTSTKCAEAGRHASAFATDSARVAPPGTAAAILPAPMSSAIRLMSVSNPSGTATTMPSMPS